MAIDEAYVVLVIAQAGDDSASTVEALPFANLAAANQAAAFLNKRAVSFEAIIIDDHDNGPAEPE